MIVDGKYDICQRVAAGGVGTVYRARHRFTGRQVALKLLNEQYTRDKIMSERFLREAKAAAEIGHPNIVEVVDAGVDEAVGVYVAFDFLEGMDLADAYRRKLLSIRQILDVGDGVLDALAAASRRRRRGPRSESGEKNVSGLVSRHAPSYCHSQVSWIGMGRRAMLAMAHAPETIGRDMLIWCTLM